MARDDGLTDRQTHPGALAGILGSEKRIEDSAAMLLRNPGTIVGEDYGDAARRIRDGALGNGQGSTAHAHRVESVDAQIDEHLLQLIGIAIAEQRALAPLGG